MSDWWSKNLSPKDAAPRPGYPPSAPMPRPSLPSLPVRTPESAPQVQVTKDNLHEAATMWGGGEGTRRETQHCPNCASDLYFSRTNTSTVTTNRGSASPSPRCYSCGYSPDRPMQGMPL